MFGEPEEYFGYNYILESGVDGCGSILLKYGDKIGNISYSKITDERSQSEILGEKGSIVIDKVSQVKGLKIKYRDGKEENIELQVAFGYNYILESGVDGCGSILLKYGDKIGNISYSKITDERSQSEILGEKGSIVIDKVSQVKGLKIKYRDGKEENIELQVAENDMVYEIDEFVNLIKNGEIESKVNSFDISRKVVEIMEKLANR